MTRTVSTFEAIRPQFETYIGDIVYATMTTVDTWHRPRTRILIAVWEVVDSIPVGWLATYPTPVKTAHLTANPHASFSYWSPRQNAVAIDTTARWTDESGDRQHAWELYEQTSPPRAGYPLGQFWTGVDDPKLTILKLVPWRVQVTRGRDLQSTLWYADRSSAAAGAGRRGADDGLGGETA